jgi:N-acetylneuraminate synthase
MKDIFVIAEAGINHNGSLDLAKKLIDMATMAGCDAVKFQKRSPDICVPETMKNVMRETPWGNITYLEYKKRLEFGLQEYSAIDEYCKVKDISWSASAWDIPSLEFLDKFNLPFHKVASALATYKTFLNEVADRGKLTYASVGMCSYEQIDTLVEVFGSRRCPLILMHTVSTYPAADSDLNLRMVQTLRDRYGLEIGYSGHETSVSPSVVAATLGAVAIERHVTLDRAMWGTDHSASLEAQGLNQLVGALRKVPGVLGDGVKKEIPAEKEIAAKMRYWE